MRKHIGIFAFRTMPNPRPDRNSGLLRYLLCAGCVCFGAILGLHKTPPPVQAPETFLVSQSLGCPVAAPVLVPDEPDISNFRLFADGTAPGYSQPEVALITYTVQSGDTLSGIAEKFNTSTSSIANLNNLTSPDRLSVGKDLSVMKNASGVVMRVSEGDTLWDISRRYGIAVSDIVTANKLADGDSISPGMTLILPGASAPRSLPVVSRSSSFRWPVSGSITSSYGWRVHPITGNESFHDGLDIATSSGTAIGAAAGGTVEFVGWLGGYGRLVIIDHDDGITTRYAHMSGFNVSEGEVVSAGETIGYVGMSGDATGPHLHFEIRKNGRTLNPRDYLP